MATHRRALGFGQSRVSEGGDMRAIGCPCGHYLDADYDDERLVA